MTQIVANIDEAADSETVQAAIEKAVPDALVVDRKSHASTALRQQLKRRCLKT